MNSEAAMESAYRALAERGEVWERGVVIAVSGGVDSVVLLHLGMRLGKGKGIRVIAAHYDHGIRGDASSADREFVFSLCQSWEVPCSVEQGDIPLLQKREGGNLEAIARRERYRFLVEIARQENVSSILTAHTADDRVETMLMNLLRGAGPRGLAGIREAAEFDGIPIHRPLLGVWREDISRYATENRLPFREDATNWDLRFLRNWVRHTMLPQLESRIPALRETLLRQARGFEAEDQRLTDESLGFFERHAETTDEGKISLPVKVLRETRPWLLHGVLRYCLEQSHAPKRVRSSAALVRLAEMLRSPRTTWSLDLPGGFHVRRDYERLVLGSEPATAEWGPMPLQVPGEVEIPISGTTIRAEVRAPREEGESPIRRQDRLTAAFDLDRLPGRLCVRSFRPGDRLRPEGMRGTQKIKQIFSDRKVPRWKRRRIPIVCAGDEPIWVVGYRLDGRYQVGEDTRRVLQVSVVPGGGDGIEEFP